MASDLPARLRTAIGDVTGRTGKVPRLKREVKQLRRELRDERQRGGDPAAQQSLDETTVVEAFHRLYRDELRLDKSTYWRGVRIIKCPLDLWVYQEIISELRPDLVIETGTMYGGSAYYLASIMDLVGHGEVMSIDIKAREGRPQHPRITYVTGSSSDPEIVARAAARASGLERVMVLLDSDHSAPHVLAELRAYHPLVTPGSYLVVEDTDINGHPVEPSFGPGPMEALEQFLAENDDFNVDRRREKFLLTYNPSGWLQRKQP